MKLSSNQKDKLNRPRPKLFLAILLLFTTPWLALYTLSAQVRQRKPEIDTQAAAYFSKQLPQRQNNSAVALEHLMGQLGLVPNIPTSPPIQVNRQNRQAFQTIRPELNQYLQRQVTSPSNRLEDVPTALQTYLTAHQPTLNAVQRHLATQPTAQWSFDLNQLKENDYALPGFLNVLNLQKLLLLSAAHHQQQSQPNKVAEMLEASWHLNEALRQRPDLTSQTLASVVLAQQTGLVRHIDSVPTVWQARMNVQKQKHNIIEGVIFENWLRYHIFQEGFEKPTHSNTGNRLSDDLRSKVSALFSPRSYFQLSVLASTTSANQAIANIRNLSLCDLPPVAVERSIENAQISRWRRNVGLSALTTARRWKMEEMRSLAMELSQQVLWAKQQFKESGEWPTQLPQESSEVCPGERWIYTLHDDNTVTITFSKALIVLPVIPLHYKSSL